jgi:lysophospholipase L1-like esterase
MRRVLIILLVFSLLLSSCNGPLETDVALSERESTAFGSWDIPGYFIPKPIHVVGLGDSLTEAVGDELKKGGYFGRVTKEMGNWRGVKEVQADNLAKRGSRSDQLIALLEKDKSIQAQVKKSDVIFLTIGGNDIMKVVKGNLFNLKSEPFYVELGKFELRLDELFGIIRGLNGDAVIVVAGLYNPITLLIDETTEFENILDAWNEAIEVRAVVDGKSCFIPVVDLFDTNENMVYHTDFFHPNAKGYETMTTRYLEQLNKCGLYELSNGELDM